MSVVQLHDIGDDNGDVVGSAAAQRQLDEPVGGGGDIGDLQRLGDGLVAHRIGQSVRTEQVSVSRLRLTDHESGFDRRTGERAHDERALRMVVRLFRSDTTLVDKGLHEGVVLGDLRQLAIAHQVRA